MKQKYNYLQNESAVNEILKHKWIESQKTGRDIGFVAAALDWIKKYGEDWKKIHNFNNKADENIKELFERRQYRRFKIDLSIKIKYGGTELDAYIKDINHIGLTLITNTALSKDKLVEIIAPIACEGQKYELSSLHLKAKIIRCSPYKKLGSKASRYLIFTKFDKDSQQMIINCKNTFFN